MANRHGHVLHLCHDGQVGFGLVMDASEINKFVALHAGQDAILAPLDGDASARRYLRVSGDEEFILMLLPEGETAHHQERLGLMLQQAGLAAPYVRGISDDGRMMIMEDFGGYRVKEQVAQSPDHEPHIYQAALEAIPALHGVSMDGLEPYDVGVYRRETDLLLDWYLPAQDVPISRSMFEEFHAACDPIFWALSRVKPVFVHRDYHAENLFHLAGRQSPKNMGMIDFQDALAGHPIYDLMSLVTDARRDVDPDLGQKLMEDFVGRVSWDRDEFDAHYAMLSFQRNAKILGIFVRLAERDLKPRYLELLPRVGRFVADALEHDALADVRQWFDNYVDDWRGRIRLPLAP